MKELSEAQLEQLKILQHAYNLKDHFTKPYNRIKLNLIQDTLINSEYFNKESKIVIINNHQIDELFKNKNINYHELLLILGRNKIAFERYRYRPKINNKQVCLYNIYTIYIN